MIDRMDIARIFTKQDFRNTYHLIQIKEMETLNTPFLTRDSQFNYRVMLFGLKNRPATIHTIIDDAPWLYNDNFAGRYLSDILINFTHDKQHEDHVQEGIERLTQFGLNCKGKSAQLEPQNQFPRIYLEL